jgi:hypothetical protein
MNISSCFRRTALALGLLFLLSTLAGCATRKIDWGTRVGNYTFDQAVIEMGPPAKQATLQDGTLVAEWMTHRGYSETYYPPGYGYRYRHYGPVYGPPIVTTSPDVFLRLTFSPDGQLVAWKKVAL